MFIYVCVIYPFLLSVILVFNCLHLFRLEINLRFLICYVTTSFLTAVLRYSNILFADKTVAVTVCPLLLSPENDAITIIILSLQVARIKHTRHVARPMPSIKFYNYNKIYCVWLMWCI